MLRLITIPVYFPAGKHYQCKYNKQADAAHNERCIFQANKNKYKAIEFIDNQIVKVIKDEMERIGEDYKMIILPDHPTPLALRTHTSEPVPFLIYQSNDEKDNPSGNYDEFLAKDTDLYFPKGYKLMDYFLKG